MRLYLVVRKDLPAGLQASQLVHVAQTFQVAHPELTAAWMAASNRVVLLEVAVAAALVALHRQAKERGLRAEPFFDEDLDPPLGALAIEPTDAARAFCRSLPLALR